MSFPGATDALCWCTIHVLVAWLLPLCWLPNGLLPNSMDKSWVFSATVSVWPSTGFLSFNQPPLLIIILGT